MGAKSEKGLSVINIDKSFANVKALVDVSLDVHEGEFFTLLGPSGCGKTTLLRIVAGLELPDNGRVLIGGRDITSLPATKRQVNTVFQSYALFPHLSIFENVAFGLRSRKFPQNEVQSRVARRLEMLGLEEMADRYPHQLSGGQQQRVALARALVTEPAIVLADEPTGNLDSKTGTAIMELLRKSCDELEQTIVVVTHDPRAAMYADRVVFLRDGHIDGELRFLPLTPLTDKLHQIIERMTKLGE